MNQLTHFQWNKTDTSPHNCSSPIFLFFFSPPIHAPLTLLPMLLLLLSSTLMLPSFVRGQSDSSLSPDQINQMLLMLGGGGACNGVNISVLRVKKLLDDELVMIVDDETGEEEMAETKLKRMAFQLCQCYWQRVRRKHTVSCSLDELYSNVDICIARIEAEEGKLDYWQRFVDLHRFFFLLNAHLFSNTFHSKFPLQFSQKLNQIMNQLTDSNHIANEEAKMADKIDAKSAKLNALLASFSSLLLPSHSLISHLSSLLITSQTLLDDLRLTHNEIYQLLWISFLSIYYIAFYILFHFSTLFIFNQSNVFYWLRQMLFIAMFIDWMTDLKKPLVSLMFMASCIPLTLFMNIVIYWKRKVREGKEGREERERMKRMEQEYENMTRWFGALIAKRKNDAKTIRTLEDEYVKQVRGRKEEVEEEAVVVVETNREEAQLLLNHQVEEGGESAELPPPPVKSTSNMPRQAISSPKGRRRKNG